MPTVRAPGHENIMVFLLLSLLFWTSIVEVRTHSVTCNEDIHCTVGFYCHPTTHTCHECLSCHFLKREPGPNQNLCIKSDKQCGPCFQGLINIEASWGAMCLPPETKSIKMRTSYIYILVTCFGIGILLSVFIIHGIWNTRIIKVHNVVLAVKKAPSQDPNGVHSMNILV